MNKIESQVLPIPPNLVHSMRAGFDAVANKIQVILIPIAVDLLIWLGPHLQIKTLIINFVNASTSTSDISQLQAGEFISSGTEMMRSVADKFNLFSLLRTIPVGIPSLMAGELHNEIPGGTPMSIDIISPLGAAFIILGLLLAGLVAGSFYYIMVVQVALQGRIELRRVFKDWSWASLQVGSLSLAFLLIFILISIPSMCLILAMVFFGLPIAQFATFLYLGFLLWLAFPLLFSTHGIFVNRRNALDSVQRSMTMTKMTLPTTSVFILAIVGLSEGLDFLWRVPPETSWLTLIGVAGHAFITSALLAASFVYYRDADNWAQATISLIKSQSKLPLQSS